ncbi:MAG: hypothetical protein ACT4OE_01005 [Sphingosinicella sp.]
MNPWPFIAAAYGLVLAGLAGLTLASFVAMRRAEKRAENLGRDK